MTRKGTNTASTNSIGDFGENLALVNFSRPLKIGARPPLFRPAHLGGKYPVVDFIVDALDENEHSLGFFFVQVKSTSAAGQNGKTLALDIDLTKYNLLAKIPAPTFLVGVDTKAEKVYLVSALRPEKTGFSSVCKKYDLLDDAVRISLHKEVTTYWKKHRPRRNQLKTAFKNERK